MTIDTELCGVKDNSVLTHVLLDGDVPVCDVTVEAAGDQAKAVMQVLSPKLWSPDSPNVYTLQTMLGNQVIRQNVGFRDLTFTTDRGRRSTKRRCAASCAQCGKWASMPCAQATIRPRSR